jgi:tocopherol O-methyltransferase
MAERAGFTIAGMEDLSENVRRTWSICARRVLGKLLTDPRYVRFLFDRSAANRIFALTLLRLLIAYRTRSMRYCLMIFEHGTV